MLFAAALLALAQTPIGLDCDFRVEAREAEIGQPVRCELVVNHPGGTKVNVDLEALLPDDGWFLLDEPKLLTSRHAANGSPGSTTTVAWTMAALESGAHSVPAPPVMCEIEGVAQTCADSTREIAIGTALLEGEDAPRPPARATLPAADAESRYVSPLWFLLLPVGIAALVLAYRFARRPRVAAEAPIPPARDRLAALDLELPPDEFCRALREHLRGGFDERAGQERRGLTDEEWLAAFVADAELHERLAKLLETCEAVRFGGRTPTRFAIEGLKHEALELVPKQEESA
ncbi:MAG: hypothetical protein H6831_03970 [Planctomycetes bacterium]|nr:hypothetical protein [Planctomycetota bacterium]MCB9903544.1 hypothetical protein [Planctomycetota bacterium]